MSKFTPGPWLCEGRTVYALQHYGWKKGDEQFCNRFCASVQDAHTPADELEANACLISASPDMYEALKEAIACGMVPISSASEGGAGGHARQVIVADMIRAALAKADGKWGGECKARKN